MSENETENGTPVSDTLLAMTVTSLENSDLSPRELMIARIAALVAVDAPAASYALNALPATESGINLDDVEDVLVAVAPIVGTTRVVSATANIARGLGFVIAYSSTSRAGCYPARAGGLWLWRTLVRSGFQAVVVPSGFTTSVQRHLWMTTWW